MVERKDSGEEIAGSDEAAVQAEAVKADVLAEVVGNLRLAPEEHPL